MNGGLLARDFDEMLGQLEDAVADPDCCARSVSDFLERHMMNADGKACQRALDVIADLAAR